MKIEELLQKILDIAMKDEQPEVTGLESEVEDGVFMPPLQLNIELMKKAVGTDNVIDDEQAAKDCGCTDECDCDDTLDDEYESEWQELAAEPEEDPLQAIRHLAGISMPGSDHPAAVLINQSTEPRF